jgi:3-oxoacyl-[acyl-carrier-protein] synthase III
VLVIGADVMSTIIDYKDRTTCVLFGDGAGAVLLEPSTDETGFIDFYNEVDGSGGCYLNMPAGRQRPARLARDRRSAHALRAPGRPPRRFEISSQQTTNTRKQGVGEKQKLELGTEGGGVCRAVTLRLCFQLILPRVCPDASCT